MFNSRVKHSWSYQIDIAECDRIDHS